MNITFWDMIPSSLLEVYRSFGETHCLHLQGRRVGRASRKQNRSFAISIENSCAMLATNRYQGFIGKHNVSKHKVSEQATFRLVA
jgi:hypothetical protein